MRWLLNNWQLSTFWSIVVSSQVALLSDEQVLHAPSLPPVFTQVKWHLLPQTKCPWRQNRRTRTRMFGERTSPLCSGRSAFSRASSWTWVRMKVSTWAILRILWIYICPRRSLLPLRSASISVVSPEVTAVYLYLLMISFIDQVCAHIRLKSIELFYF